MENTSIKDKILHWSGIALVSTVIIGGSYYIYQSIFGSSEDEKEKEKEENNISENNNNNSLNNSFQNSNNNIEINSSNKINNNINSIILQKNENLNLIETDNINNNNNNNINNTITTKLIKDEEDPEINEEKLIEKNIINTNINIFKDNTILLKSFGINIDESKIFQNNNNQLTDEGTVRLIIYINFLADKFYILDNPTLDEKRRNLLNEENNGINNSINNINNLSNNELNKEQEYLTLCNETLICKQNAYQIAAEKILNSFKIKINFDRLEEFIKNIDTKKIEDLTIKIMSELNPGLHKYDLNFMDINQTKEAYIYYLKTFIENAKKISEQLEKIKNDEENIINNEENNIPIFQFMTLKMKMDDLLYNKYNLVDEHLKLLVNKYNLLVDNEINLLQNEYEDLIKKFGDIK